MTEVVTPEARRKRRLRRRGLLLTLLVLLLPGLVLGGLLASPLGLKALLSYGLKQAPLVTIANVEGSLLTGFTLQKVRYVTEYEDLQIAALTLEISPLCLLSKKLCIETLAVQDFDWHILRHRESPSFDFPAVELPPLHIPVTIDIQHASLNRLTLHLEHSQFDIRDALLKIHSDNDTVFISEARTELMFSALTIRAAVDGSLDLRGATAANLSAKVGLDFTADVPDLNIEGDIHGSAYDPELSVSTHGLVEAHTEMNASFRKKGWPVYARVKQNAPITLAKSVPVTLSDSVAIISGYVNAYHVEGQTTVTGVPRTPPVTAGIITDGGFFGLSNGEATLSILKQSVGEPSASGQQANGQQVNRQQAEVRGEFTWYPRLYWNTEVDFAHIDVATWLEGATSNLNGSAQVSGEWYPQIPFRNTVNEFKASGQWRTHPVAIGTTFTTTATTLDISQLQATLGRNHASLQGGVTTEWNLAGDFDLPQLNSVLPQLDGAISGKLAITGARATPRFNVSAVSPNLKVYDTLLEKVTATLHGDTGQHQLAATAQWQGYAANASVAGRLEKERWHGQIQSLDIAREATRFSLSSAASLAYTLDKKALQLGNTCLRNAKEEVCASADWNLSSQNGTLVSTLAAFESSFISPLVTAFEGEPGHWSGKAEARFARQKVVAADWQMQVDKFKLNRVLDKRFIPGITTERVHLQGKLAQQQLQLESRILWPDQQVTQLTATVPDIRQTNTFNLRIDTSPLPVGWASPWVNGIVFTGGTLGGTIKGTVMQGWPALVGTLNLEGGQLHTHSKSWGLETLSSRLQLNGTTATLSGDAEDDRGMHWTLSTPMILNWSESQRQLRLQQGCLSTANSQLCSKGHYSLDSGIDMTAEAEGNISPWLAPVFTDNTLIDGPFQGTARLKQTGDQLTGDVHVHSTVSSSIPADDGASPPKADISLDAQLANHLLVTRMIVRGSENSVIEGLLQTQINGEKAIDGHIDVRNVEIAPLKPMIRELEQLAGNINGTFLISGSLKKPTLEGELTLNDGKLSSAIYPIAFSKISANAKFTQQNTVLNADLESGKHGRATLRSEANWKDGTLLTQSHFTSQRLPIKQGSDINLKLDTDLTLASRHGRIDLGGLIHVREGFLRVAKLPENSTHVSKDVVFVDERGAQESETGIDAHLNLAVQLSDMVQLDGLGAQVRMNGAVGIQQTPPNDAVGRGTLTISEGTYTGYGQKLKISKGQILFNGPLDSPVLAIKAVREATSAEGSSVVAGINISGTPQQPESTLFSVPAMPEQDILRYIVTGRPPGSNGSDNRIANQALLSVGLYGSEDFTRDLASKVGIDDFEISTSTNTDDRNSVNVGGYLSPKLFVQYGVGLNTVNTLTLRYRLTQSVFLEALSGAESALDVLYSFEVE